MKMHNRFCCYFKRNSLNIYRRAKYSENTPKIKKIDAQNKTTLLVQQTFFSPKILTFSELAQRK